LKWCNEVDQELDHFYY